MTAETFHDAISLLPVDLVAQADRKRNPPRPVLRWQRYAAMAACFGIIAFSSLWCVSHLRMGSSEAASYDMAIAPMAAQAPEMGTPAEADTGDLLRAQTTMETNLPASGSAKIEDASQPALTVYRDGTACPLNPADQETLWIMFNSLSYDPQAICNCIAPITIAVEGEIQYEVNLEEGYVRCAQGQASLTQEQLDILTAFFSELAGE